MVGGGESHGHCIAGQAGQRGSKRQRIELSAHLLISRAPSLPGIELNGADIGSRAPYCPVAALSEGALEISTCLSFGCHAPFAPPLSCFIGLISFVGE
jgi:hypothetical protein